MGARGHKLRFMTPAANVQSKGCPPTLRNCWSHVVISHGFPGFDCLSFTPWPASAGGFSGCGRQLREKQTHKPNVPTRYQGFLLISCTCSCSWPLRKSLPAFAWQGFLVPWITPSPSSTRPAWIAQRWALDGP